MDLKRVYYDMDGFERTILEMVHLYPEWAANRIQAGEDAIDKLTIRTRQAPVIEKPTERRQSENEIQSLIQYACEHKSWNALARALVEILDEIAEIRRQGEEEDKFWETL